jgi:hypothetical protein
MKKAKRKKDAPRSATAIDAYMLECACVGVLKMGQEHLAKALGVTKQQIQKYEAARTGSARRGCSAFAGF